MRTFKAIPFEQLQDGEYVTFFGVHMLRWNFQEWGDPTMAFVDVKMESILDSMTDDERLELFGNYCKHCGRKDPRCQCWNDE